MSSLYNDNIVELMLSLFDNVFFISKQFSAF